MKKRGEARAEVRGSWLHWQAGLGPWGSAGSCQALSGFGRLGLGSPTRPGSGAPSCLFAAGDLLR